MTRDTSTTTSYKHTPTWILDDITNISRHNTITSLMFKLLPHTSSFTFIPVCVWGWHRSIIIPFIHLRPSTKISSMPPNRLPSLEIGMCMCVCVCVCMRVCAMGRLLLNSLNQAQYYINAANEFKKFSLLEQFLSLGVWIATRPVPGFAPLSNRATRHIPKKGSA